MTDEELLNALVDDYVAWWGPSIEPYEDAGRYFTLVRAAELVLGRDEVLATRWLERHIEEKLSVKRQKREG